MNSFSTLTIIALSLIICLATLALAGGDKSAKTTVITLAGGGDKHQGNYIPIPIPVCTNGKMAGGFGGHSYGGHGGHSHYGGAQARMGWRR